MSAALDAPTTFDLIEVSARAASVAEATRNCREGDLTLFEQLRDYGDRLHLYAAMALVQAMQLGGADLAAAERVVYEHLGAVFAASTHDVTTTKE